MSEYTKPKRPFNNIVGQTINGIAVLELLGTKTCNTYFLCQCPSCETKFPATRQNLIAGRHRSCGCIKAKWGGLVVKFPREYASWGHMWDRCLNPRDKRWADYGGRGISICARWDSFVNFLADMGPRPSETHSLDRIDVNGNYEPGNCRWATRQEQAKNIRQPKGTQRVTWNGRTQSISGWAREFGLPPGTMYKRLFILKWPLDQAMQGKLFAKSGRARKPLLRPEWRVVDIQDNG